MNLICDTNVFYNASSGVLDESDLKNAGDIYISPTSILELISKIDKFDERRRAANWILCNDVKLLSDTESWISEVWNIRAPAIPENVWLEGLRALQGAQTPEHLETGVVSWRENVVRAVNLSDANAHRCGHYNEFQEDMILAIEKFRPGYQKKLKKNKLKQASKNVRAQIEIEFSNPAYHAEILKGTYDRALLCNPNIQRTPFNREILEKACNYLQDYVKIYAEYFKSAVCGDFKPKPNDWGDLECFVYLREGWQVVTSEDRWLTLANQAGLGNKIAYPKQKS